MATRHKARWVEAACILSGHFLAVAALSHERRAFDSVNPIPHVGFNDSIPFYMYELPRNASACPPGKMMVTPKMFPDWAMHVGLQEHPWRTRDIKKAVLFYMPAHLSAIVWSQMKGDIDPCWEYERLYLMRMVEHVGSSPYLIRNGGRDHFTTAHHFAVKAGIVGDLFGAPAVELLGKMTLLTDDLMSPRLFKRHRGDVKQRVTVPYADVYHYSPPPAAVPFAARNHSLIFMGQADDRKAYRARAHAFGLGKWFSKAVLVCVGGCLRVHRDYDKCSSVTGRLNGCLKMHSEHIDYRSLVRDSKFGLFFRGDSASSSRLYDYISSGVVPIIVSDEWAPFDPFAMPFKEDVPWDNFTFTVPQQEFMSQLKASISKIVFAPPAVVDEKLRVLEEVRSSLTWVGDGMQSRVHSLVLRKVARDAGLPVQRADHRQLPAVSMRGLLSVQGPQENSSSPAANVSGSLLSHRSPASAAEEGAVWWESFWEEATAEE